jgi:hypothetical protein
VALRAAARRPQSEGQKAKKFDQVAEERDDNPEHSSCLHVNPVETHSLNACGLHPCAVREPGGFSFTGPAIALGNAHEARRDHLRGGLQIHSVDTEAVKLRKRRKLTGRPFDLICQTGYFTVVVGDGQNVDSTDRVG